MQGNAREGGRGHSLGQAPLSEYVKKFILGIPGYWDLEKTVLLCDGLCHKDCVLLTSRYPPSYQGCPGGK